MWEFYKTADWQAFASVASVVGLFVALIGIYITIEQVKKVKTSSEAAEAAIKDLKLKISHFDIVQEIASAESSLARLKECENDQADMHWKKYCDDLTISLIRIKESFSEASGKTKDQLGSAINHASTLMGRTSFLSDSSLREQAKTRESFREIHMALVKVQVQIQRDQ